MYNCSRNKHKTKLYYFDNIEVAGASRARYSATNA